MQLTNEERMLVNSELQRKGKSMLLSYVLLIFLGSLGIHRFYLGKKGSAIAQLCLTVGGWLTAILIIGIVALIVVGVWLIVDLFLVPAIVEHQNSLIEDEIVATLER
ncbi:hypothetical protein GCM10028778_12270 [Barrientosiimonas marina]|uniref:TM2 domain-containing protein n=1 Tax=Lentibacillus kimchii TaxID=1542911 RepID=A0ABW2UVL3_9BACI